MSSFHLCISWNETLISKTELYCSVSQFLHSYICERFTYFQVQPAYSAAGKYVDWSWEYIVQMYIDHRHMNVEIGTESTQFPEKEYINGIFLEVCAVWYKKTVPNGKLFYTVIFSRRNKFFDIILTENFFFILHYWSWDLPHWVWKSKKSRKNY